MPGGTVVQTGVLYTYYPRGTDTFVFATRDFGEDTIVDFEVGRDRIDFRGSGLAASDLAFGWDAGTLTVDAGSGNTIKLQNLGETQPDRDAVLATFLFDPLPVVSVDDATVTEGGEMRFAVSLDRIRARDVTVTWSTSDGTATDGSDYTGQSGQTLTIPAGQTSAAIVVQTADDADVEQDESLTVTLSDPVNATLGDAVGEGVITDDDEPVQEAQTVEVSEQDIEYSSQETGTPARRTGTMEADDPLTGGEGVDFINARGGDDVASGRGGDDRIWGGLGDDRLNGEVGDDRLYGGRGQDVLNGGSGDDVLYGGKGDDVLRGGTGADRLEGGRGDDVLRGGAGADAFVYGDTEFGEDRIRDFEDGTDMLDLSGSGLQWSDLTVSNDAKGHAVVRVAGSDSRIVLEGVDAALVDQGDFVF